MRKNLLLLAVVSFLFCASLKAQDNVIKWNLGSLTSLKIGLGYERVINKKQSFSIYLDYKIPIITGKRFFPVEDEDGNIIGVKRNGFSISPEYRFYTNSKKDAPHGFFVAPFLKYSRTKYFGGGYISTDGNDTYKGDVNAFINSMGGGVQLGYQWVINDQITIDFAFFGLGINRNVIGIDIIPDDKTLDLEQAAKDIESEVSDIPIIGKRIKASAKDDKVVVKLPFMFPMLRGTISIGYVF